MDLQIIATKLQYVYFTGRKKGASNCVPGKGRTGERERGFRVKIGTYIEFSDGWNILGPDGRIHKGRGTVVRFNYRAHTWSVQPPQRCELNIMGHVFSRQGEPCWLKDERETGFTQLDFRRSFSPSFVKLCEAGHALAEGRSERKSGSIEKNVPWRLDSTFAER